MFLHHGVPIIPSAMVDKINQVVTIEKCILVTCEF